jgi:hypothetical protein
LGQETNNTGTRERRLKIYLGQEVNNITLGPAPTTYLGQEANDIILVLSQNLLLHSLHFDGD